MKSRQWKRIRKPLETLWSIWKPSETLWKPFGNPLFHGLLPGREWGFLPLGASHSRSGVAPTRYQAEVHHTINKKHVSQYMHASAWEGVAHFEVACHLG